MNELHLFTDDTETVIAYDAEDAIRVWAEHSGEDPASYGDELGFYQVDDDAERTVYLEELPIGFPGLIDAGGDVPEPFEWAATGTARQWADWAGRSYLCSTEW